MKKRQLLLKRPEHHKSASGGYLLLFWAKSGLRKDFLFSLPPDYDLGTQTGLKHHFTVFPDSNGKSPPFYCQISIC
jgi:hypothetical protein